jgi:hypothetical protein
MKTKTITAGTLSILALALIIMIGCNREDSLTSNVDGIAQRVDVNSVGSGQSCVQLTAGQTINSGSVCFDDIDTDNDNVDDALQVCYTTTGGWEMTEVHFFIGTSMTQIPMTKSGNPIPGQFPYSQTFSTAQTNYCFTIPFSTLGFTCPGPTKYVVAAHAAVRKQTSSGGYETQTGWGAGTRITTKGNWGTYFDIYISCDPPTAELTCDETAFAYGNDNANCFSEYDEFLDNAERWGWTNGALVAGTYEFPLYAGAGQCDLSKGTECGTLTIVYNGSTAVVTYTTDGSHSLVETHLYVGSNEFATIGGNPNNPNYGENTIAPGQFPYQSGALASGTTSWSYTVTGLSGNIYVVAHASVNGFACPNEIVGD